MPSVGPVCDDDARLLPDFRLPNRSLGGIAAILDGFVLVGSSVLARILYSGLDSLSSDDLGVGVVATFVFLGLAKLWGLHRFQTVLSPETGTARIMAASVFSVVAVICIVFLLKDGADYSRGAMSLFAIIALILTPIGRVLLAEGARAAIDAGFLRGRRVVLIGDEGELERLTPAEILNFGLDAVGRFPLSPGSPLEEISADDRSLLDQAMRAARKSRASEFALFLPWGRDRALSMISLSLRASPLPVRLYPDHRIRDLLLQKRESQFDPYLSVEIQREPLNRMERALKRAFDIAVSSVGLLCLSPLLLMTAVLIKIDSAGPILFVQTRRGFDNRSFKIWNFRTMTVFEDDPGLRRPVRDDERVTRIGGILRRSSVDKLPQLVNVLRGDMSIVGPRPHAAAHDERYEAHIGEYAFRRHVKPGLTGTAQMLGRRYGARTLERMEAHVQRDLWYINHWSPWLDIKIVAMTFVARLTEEAY